MTAFSAFDASEKGFSVGDLEIKKDDYHDRCWFRTGDAWELPTIEPKPTAEFKTLLEWATVVRKLGVRANADTPEATRHARDFGAEGIRLCRTERMLNTKERLPIVKKIILADTEEDKKRALDKL